MWCYLINLIYVDIVLVCTCGLQVYTRIHIQYGL